MYYNIALYPCDGVFLKTCVDIAQTHLRQVADGYLLGAKADPHVTLCQFLGEPDELEKIWQLILPVRKDPVSVMFQHVYVLPGSGMHEGYNWVGLSALADSAIIILQGTVYELLFSIGIESSTKVETYFPHLTWARCRSSELLSVPIPKAELFNAPHRFELTIGMSDVNGAYQGRLYPI
jgi:2'-5' RNA ligase